jgi:uncharacterized surface protein with fasciclin (FAS1) repeats
MHQNENGLIGILIAAVIALAGAAGGTAYVENKAEQDAIFKTDLFNVKNSLEEAQKEARERLPNISVDSMSILSTDGQYTTFVGLLNSSGESDRLKSGQYTIFAPTNDAFSRLAPGQLDEISKDPAKVKAMLEYHMVTGLYDIQRIVNLATLPSVQGSALGVKLADGQPQINGFNIIRTNTRTSNGIIHALDGVLIPSS